MPCTKGGIVMPHLRLRLVPFLAGSLLVSNLALAAALKTYQVTGPVLEINAEKIVVQKGSERWEIARDALTRMPSDVKVGDKVTIEYRMMATRVESKGIAKSDSTAPKKK
jgi:hypothetical protein